MPVKSIKRKKKLTVKDVKFARLQAEGYSKIEAYYKAYNCKNPNRKTVKAVASKYSLVPEVQAKVQAFKEQFRKDSDIASKITIESQLQRAEIVFQKTLEGDDFASALKALDMQNKLVGIYAPTQIESKNLNVNLTKVPDGGVDV